MAFADRFKFHFWSEADAISDLIKRWEPKNCKKEKDYETSLVAFIRSELPQVRVTPQYAVGRTKADLVIAEKVIIEIKINLKSTASYHRLLGQLSCYSKWEGKVIILLIGTTDPDFKMTIQREITKLNDPFGLLADRFFLFEKQ